MPILEIHEYPDPILKKKSDPVAKVDASVQRLIRDMLETMYDAPGVGLAAPQVGVSRRIIVIDTSREGEDPRPFCMVNPEVTWASEETCDYKEGCLSVPEQYADVTRPKQVRVRYLDQNGKQQEIEAEGLLATVVQHEIDHLNGILFVDRLSPLKRKMVLRKLEKSRKREAEDLLDDEE